MRITGFACTLVVGRVLTSIYNIGRISAEYHPIGVDHSTDLNCSHGDPVNLETTIGKELNSEPIPADAKCTMVCVYMSGLLLIGSGIYELTALPYVDSLGTLALPPLRFGKGWNVLKSQE